MHVRYTANTFPEDLMFTQTKDRQNWQTRYVIQQPYDSNVAACSARVAEMDCEAMCKPRVAQVLAAPAWDGQKQIYKDKDPIALQRDCVAACVVSKQNGIASASRYYQSDLPTRLNGEKQTLAKLTGWKMSDIDAMPDARKYLGADMLVAPVNGSAPAAAPWWERLFSGSKNVP